MKQAVVVGPANISAFRPLLLRGGLLFVLNRAAKVYDPTDDRLIDPPLDRWSVTWREGERAFVQVFGKQGLILRQVMPAGFQESANQNFADSLFAGTASTGTPI